MIQRMNPHCDLEVDGGIDEASAPLAAAAGANVLVAGSSVFAADRGVATAMEILRTSVSQMAH
jgi:ribulose-phosphate 3-epimerase